MNIKDYINKMEREEKNYGGNEWSTHISAPPVDLKHVQSK